MFVKARVLCPLLIIKKNQMKKQNNRVPDTLFSASYPHLHKHTSVYQILLTSIIALGGIIAIVFALQSDESDSTLCMSMLTLGVLLLLFSIYRFSWKCTETVYQPTGSVVQRGTLYMDTVELQRVQDMIEKNDFSDSFHSSFKGSGNGRMDYMISQDGRFCAIQLLCFVPYTYEPVTDRCYYADDEAISIARCLGIK